MIICSFDIGIRNLSYCILEDTKGIVGNRFKVYDWKLIDLLERTPNHGEEFICQCLNINGKCFGGEGVDDAEQPYAPSPG